uniref:Zonadhesin n=1 Tax=Xenopus tropicalis TaxID=8364 RepID=A0A803JSD6_XENTR
LCNNTFLNLLYDVVCQSDKCPPNNYCGIVNGVPECSEFTFGECTIYGDPHYYSFDKMTHHFMGVCTYTLAKFCSNSSSLPYFNVEAKNEHRGNPSVSWVQKVMVEVYDYHITIVKDEPNRVLLNGIWKTLPISLRNGTLTVERSGRYILVETDFKLTVSYDTDHTVEVKVPTIYFNQTCGICGNLNNDYNDEYLMPNGQQAQDSHQFGNSWKVDDDDPTCTPVPPPPICPPEKEESYKSEAFCGPLISKDSPFQVCHSVINPDAFFESCVFDLCVIGDDFLCTALESYAGACQRAGVKIQWRNSTFCPLDCPINSHYNECSSACPGTCLNQNAPDNCNKPCIEDCDCDDGFVLSGSSCVPVNDCGCSYEGTYYEKNEMFWQTGCVGQCTCIGNNQVDCKNDSCGPDLACKVQNGVLGCYPADSNICHIYGDPHYITFDGKLYNFQGSCNYTVVETCKNSSQYFSVTTRNEHRGSLSWTKKIVEVRGNTIDAVNGEIVSLPYTLIPGISITLNGYVIVETDFGLEVKYNGDQELIVKVNENFKGQLCGLCGTYNGNILDDFLKPDGLLAQTPNEFGNSWRVPDDNWICDPNVVDPAPCDPIDEKHYEDMCKSILSSSGPFAACHFFVLPQLYFQSCVYDMCTAGGTTEQFCNALEAYAGACESAGVQLGDWRKDTICETSTTTPPTTTTPTTTPTPGSLCPWSCNFDADFCTWSQSSLDDFDWIRHTGSTPSTGSGPSFDHTTGNGFYIYIDGRSPTAGQKARLLSPICNSGGHQCLSFWYHMFGVAKTMELNVYIVRNGKEELVWNLTGHQENNWFFYLSFSFNFFSSQIILEGVRGNDFRSDVAVDDIFISPGFCSGKSVIILILSMTRVALGWHNTKKKPSGSRPLWALPTQARSRPVSVGTANPSLLPTSTCGHCQPKPAPDQYLWALPTQACSLPVPVGTANPTRSRPVPVGTANPSLLPTSTCGPCQPKPAPYHCNLPCVEGCFCDPGYVLYNKKCVPSLQCGCWDGNNYYPVGSEFWTDDTCSTKCRCPSAGSALICNSATCNSNQYCATINNVSDLTYVQKVFVEVYGYNIQIIRKETSRVLVRNISNLYFIYFVAKSNFSFRYVNSLEGQRARLVRRNRVDGVWNTLPASLKGGSVSVTKSGRYIVLETDFKLSVSYDTDHSVEVKIPDTYSSQLCGMCGNFNGQIQDEYLMPNGQQAVNVIKDLS